MKNLPLLSVLLAIICMVGVTPASFAGGARWIMTMNSERMIQEKLIHVRFIGKNGAALESRALEQLVIRENNCDSDPPLQMIKDYKMGFAPENMLVGIYLFPHAWTGKSLCFSMPNQWKIERSVATMDNDGHSIQLNMAP